MYAIVDIETTGGSAANSGITEIAIVLHNGTSVEGKFETLINPGQKIPRYITALTGITDFMVADAPTFEEAAPKIFNLLKGRIFVAHNVNFDYSFLLHHLNIAGYDWQAKKLCTVRYARKVIPGRRSYSLGNICRDLEIENEARHRAAGDAIATVALFEHLLQMDTEQQHLKTFLKGKTPETYLPMHVPAHEMEQLPYGPGVYYFKDQQGKIVYVGKAKNLKYRVRSHFANNSSSRRKQDFIRNIFHIEYEPCVTELHALVWEELEIKRLWPLYNRSQKRYSQLYGLYALQDQRGLTRLAVEKRRKHLPAIASFHQQEAGYTMGRKLVQQFEIDERLLFATGHFAENLEEEALQLHNRKMKDAMFFLQEEQPSFCFYQFGENETGQPQTICYLLEKGCFAGLSIHDGHAALSWSQIQAKLEPAPDNDFIKAMLFRSAASKQEYVIHKDVASE